MTDWAGFVFGRTAVKDYRVLAVPHWLAEPIASSLDWLLPSVLATLRTPDGLRASPRWMLLQTSTWHVVGVACMAFDLLGRPTDEQRIARTRDALNPGQRGRDLYVFAGYIAPRQPGDEWPAVPTCTNTGLEYFEPLYRFVDARWDEKQYQHLPPLVAPAESPRWPRGADVRSTRPLQRLTLNRDPARTGLWPDDEPMRLGLWAAALDERHEMSLHLGLPSRGDALNSGSLNASVVGLGVAEVGERPRPAAAAGDRSRAGAPAESPTSYGSPAQPSRAAVDEDDYRTATPRRPRASGGRMLRGFVTGVTDVVGKVLNSMDEYDERRDVGGGSGYSGRTFNAPENPRISSPGARQPNVPPIDQSLPAGDGTAVGPGFLPGYKPKSEPAADHETATDEGRDQPLVPSPEVPDKPARPAASARLDDTPLAPMLRYAGVVEAMEWLSKAFGFQPVSEPTTADGQPMQGMLVTEGGGVLVIVDDDRLGGSETPRQHREYCPDAPKSTAPYGFQAAILVHVSDIEAHCRRARAAGAVILAEINLSSKHRQYRAEDLDGHRWVFRQWPRQRRVDARGQTANE